MPHLIVHTLILNPKNQVLIIKRAKQEKVLPGLWDLPGGSLRLKEGPAKGAIREAFEETGLKIIEPKIFASVSNWDKAKQTQFIILFFWTKKYRGRLKLNFQDHDEYQWANSKKIKKLKTVSYLPKIINYFYAPKS